MWEDDRRRKDNHVIYMDASLGLLGLSSEPYWNPSSIVGEE